jgi:hypothetical protein
MREERYAIALIICLAGCLGCGDPSPSCPAMEVSVTCRGDCCEELGFVWDGRRCAEIAGCACSGSDCQRLFADEVSCARDRGRDCFACAPMDVRPLPESACLPEQGAVSGYVWDGAACRHVASCGLDGTDRDRRFESLEACTAAYGACERVGSDVE